MENILEFYLIYFLVTGIFFNIYSIVPIAKKIQELNKNIKLYITIPLINICRLIFLLSNQEKSLFDVIGVIFFDFALYITASCMVIPFINKAKKVLDEQELINMENKRINDEAYKAEKIHLKRLLYVAFLNTMYSFNKSDDKELKRYTTKEFYNLLKSELKENSFVKNKFEKFELKSFNITNNNEINGHFELTANIEVTYTNFSTVNDKVVGGSPEEIKLSTFKVSFISVDDTSKFKCRYCGAPFTTLTKGTCDYCNRENAIPDLDWLVSNIEEI